MSVLATCSEALRFIEAHTASLIESHSVIGDNGKPAPGTLDKIAAPEVRKLRKLSAKLRAVVEGRVSA